MPIKTRIDMLTTGVRTPVGHQDLRRRPGAKSSASAREIEHVLPQVAGTRSVFAERTGGGYFLDFDLKRDQPGALRPERRRCADGGDERHRRRERHHHRRGARALSRQRPLPCAISAATSDALGRVLVPAMDGKLQIPLAEIATLKLATGPAMMRDENGMLSGYVYVDVAGRDVGSYVDEAKQRGAASKSAAARLHAGLERPVRGHGARPRAAEGRAAADAVPDLPAALPEHALHGEDLHHPAGGAVLGGGRDLAAATCSATT